MRAEIDEREEGEHAVPQVLVFKSEQIRQIFSSSVNFTKEKEGKGERERDSLYD